jgi:hypothetical protein
MAPGGVLYTPSRAICARGIPSPRSGVVRPIARGGTQSPAQAPTFVTAGQVRRGRIYDRHGVLLASTVANARGIFTRTYRDPSLAQTIGYASDLYGKSGIEAAYHAYLAGRSSGSGWPELVNRSLQRSRERVGTPDTSLARSSACCGSFIRFSGFSPAPPRKSQERVGYVIQATAGVPP